jgi:hypothetical protein
MLLLHVGAQTRVVSWSPRGSGTTTTLLASPRYAYSSSPLQGLSYSCTYGLIWFHLCLFIFRKIYKPLDLLVFQLLVKVGSFVAWPGFCTYEKTAIAAEYSKLLGLEEVEAFLTAGATAYLRMQKIWGTSLQCKRYEALRFNAKDTRSPASVSLDLRIRQSGSGAVHFLRIRRRVRSRPFIFFWIQSWVRSRSFSLGPPPDLKPSVHFLWFLIRARAVRHFLWDPQPDPEPYRSLGHVSKSGRTDHSNIDSSSGLRGG